MEDPRKLTSPETEEYVEEKKEPYKYEETTDDKNLVGKFGECLDAANKLIGSKEYLCFTRNSHHAQMVFTLANFLFANDYADYYDEDDEY